MSLNPNCPSPEETHRLASTILGAHHQFLTNVLNSVVKLAKEHDQSLNLEDLQIIMEAVVEQSEHNVRHVVRELEVEYPKDWADISRRIRFERAISRCECHGECGVDHADENDRFGFCPPGYSHFPDERCSALHHAAHHVTGSKVVLTVAHLDHVPEHCGDDNLKAMCQRCHLRYDAEHQRWDFHPGEVRAVYEFRKPDNRRRDLGNIEKACSDLLVSHRVIADDCLIVELTLRWNADLPLGTARVTIRDADD